MVGHRARFAAPFVIAGLVAAGAAIPTVGASAAPRLPSLTPRQLVTKVLDQHVTAFSGRVQWSPDLGLPSLGSLTDGAGQNGPVATPWTASSLLSSAQTFSIWVDGDRQRVAAPNQLSEADFLHRGSQAWTWQSATQHVVHYVIRGQAGHPSRPSSPAPSPASVATAF